MLEEVIVRSFVQQIPEAAISRQRCRQSKPKRSTQDGHQPVKPADNKEQRRVFNLRLRDPKTNYREQRQRNFGDVHIAASPIFRQTEWIVSRRNCKENTNDYRGGQSKRDCS